MEMAHVIANIGNLFVGQNKSAPVAATVFFGKLHPKITLQRRPQGMTRTTAWQEQARSRHGAENLCRHNPEANLQKKEVETGVVNNERATFQAAPDFWRQCTGP